MKIYRPLQISLNTNVIEQDRKFFFTVSASLGIDISCGRELLDINYLQDAFEAMGENPVPDPGMPKPNGEFIVSGNFYPPGKKPSKGGEVKVGVGNIEKKLYIFGKRYWKKGIPTQPELLNYLSLDYKYAFGGKGFDYNPEGTGFNDGLLPLIEYPDALTGAKKDRPMPAGLSPLDPMNPLRTKYQGTYDSDYMLKYYPGYPKDHDWRYFLNSPEDQWVKDFFRGDEYFFLENLHPDKNFIKGNLPGLYPRCFLNCINNETSEFKELNLNLDTIHFFPEKLLSLLIFRGVAEVHDDEALDIKDIILGYERLNDKKKSYDHYKYSFDKRKNSDDDLLNNLKTKDLIPDGCRTAMEILLTTADSEDQGEFSKNMDAMFDSFEKKIDEETDKALADAQNVDFFKYPPAKVMENLSEEEKKSFLTKDGTPDLKKMMKKDKKSDSDLEELNSKLESIIPGITGETGKNIDLSEFSFDKLDEIFNETEVFIEKKLSIAEELISEETDRIKKELYDKIRVIDDKIESLKAEMPGEKETAQSLEDAKESIYQALKQIEGLSDNSTEKAPLPRFNSGEITRLIEDSYSGLDPVLSDTLNHLNVLKNFETDTQQIDHINEKIIKIINDNNENGFLNDLKETLKQAKKDFMEIYLTSAHYLDYGTSPHKISANDLKESLLKQYSENRNLSGKDFACIDLSGENLDGIDLSGALLEQVNFNKTSLKGANLSGTVLSRADLRGADLFGADLRGANLGDVKAQQAYFSKSNLESAILSKGDFTNADFTYANLKDVEMLEITLNCSDFSNAVLNGASFIERDIKGTLFINSDLSSSYFINCEIEDCDFSGAVMKQSAFVDTSIKNTSFITADISSSSFISSGEEGIELNKVYFTKAVLKQTSFNNIILKNSDFSFSNIENSYFQGSDLTGADFKYANALNANFRKTVLINANMEGINLSLGSLSKADLFRTNLKKANLYGTDLLRANIKETELEDTNLDRTILENTGKL